MGATNLVMQVKRLQEKSGKKHVVYSCVTNSYSEVLPPPHVLRGTFDFILLSDKPCAIDGWTSFHFEQGGDDPRRRAKYYKILPHQLLTPYESSVWVDGNMKIFDSLSVLLKSFLQSDDVIVLFHHRRRDCLYEEAIVCRHWGKDDPETIRAQMQKYRQLGHPEHWGLFMGGIIVRKHNNSECQRTMWEWWQEIQAYSVRDQLSLPFVLRRNSTRLRDLPYESLGRYAAALPHKKYRSYALSGRNILNVRAWLAPAIYRITNAVSRMRKLSPPK